MPSWYAEGTLKKTKRAYLINAALNSAVTLLFAAASIVACLFAPQVSLTVAILEWSSAVLAGAIPVALFIMVEIDKRIVETRGAV